MVTIQRKKDRVVFVKKNTMEKSKALDVLGISTNEIEKSRGKKDPVGTIRDGRKKVSEGKWVSVGKGKGGSKSDDDPLKTGKKEEETSSQLDTKESDERMSEDDILNLKSRISRARKAYDSYKESGNKHGLELAKHALDGYKKDWEKYKNQKVSDFSDSTDKSTSEDKGDKEDDLNDNNAKKTEPKKTSGQSEISDKLGKLREKGEKAQAEANKHYDAMKEAGKELDVTSERQKDQKPSDEEKAYFKTNKEAILDDLDVLDTRTIQEVIQDHMKNNKGKDSVKKSEALNILGIQKGGVGSGRIGSHPEEPNAGHVAAEKLEKEQEASKMHKADMQTVSDLTGRIKELERLKKTASNDEDELSYGQDMIELTIQKAGINSKYREVKKSKALELLNIK